MIIEKIEIESYAAIRNLTLSLSDGINVIEGSNESGKSSIADFIKFVLYGVSGKGSDGHLSERKRAINFLDSHAGGALCVRVGERRYRITRNTAVSGTVRESVRTKFSVIDTESGKDVSDGREPGEQLLGIPEGVFVRSAYLRQGGERGLDGGDVQGAITNIVFSGDERLNVEKAIERINNARIPLSHKHGNVGKIHDLKSEILTLQTKLSEEMQANEQIISLEASAREKKNTNAEHISKYEYLERKKKAFDCAKILESFTQLSDAQKEKVSAEMALLEFKAQAHIPTDEEMDELRAYERSLNTVGAQLSDALAERSRLELEKEQLKISRGLKDAIEQAGDSDALFERAERASNASRRLMIFSLLSLLLGAMAVGGAFLIGSLFLPFMCVAGVFCALFAVLLIASLSKKKLTRSICSCAECRTPQELSDAIDAYERSKELMASLERAIAENAEQISEYKELAAAERVRLSEFLLDMDIEDISDPVSSIPKITDMLLMRSRKAAELESEERMARAYYEGILSKTQDHDIEKVEAELAACNIEDPLDCDREKTVRNIKFYRDQSELLGEKIHELEIKLAEMRATVTSPSKIRERITELAMELASCEKKHAAYVLAEESLRSAAEEMRRGIAPALAKTAGGYMSTLTDGKYGELLLDPSFSLSYEAFGEPRHIDYMSTGTQDMAYLSLRLSLADVVSKEGALPIVLDEAMAHLDDGRAKNLISLLSERSREGIQHILFTCHGREEELLLASGCEHNYVKL